MKFKKYLNESKPFENSLRTFERTGKVYESGFDPAFGQVMANFTKDCYEETGKYPFDIDRTELHKTKAYKKMQDECEKIRNKD